MGIDHGGAHILMAEQFLDGPDIIAILNQVRGKRMPQGMTTGRLGYSGFPGSFFDGLLDNGLMEMMPVLLAGHPIRVVS